MQRPNAVEVPEVDLSGYVLAEATGRGERTALVDGPTGREVSSAGLVRSVGCMAAGLRERGFESGDVLAIHLPNVPEYAVCFHAALRAGGTVTTLNPLYKADEIAHQLADAGARILVTGEAFADVARDAASRVDGVEEVVVVSHGDEAPGGLSRLMADEPDAAEAGPEPDALAVLPYSSGTTGLPKGVMLTHRNLVANLVQTQAMLDLGAEDVLIGVLPFFHIYGMTVIMNLGLRQGSTIVTMPRFDLDRFLDLIEARRVTRAFVVPPIALALAKHPAVEGRDLSSLTTIMSGAAPLGAELAGQVADRIGCTVMQGYGLTEASPVTHVVPLDAGEGRGGSIGVPVPGTECRIVDPAGGSDLGPGERGELWIKGPQVMRGYLNNPDATAATIDSDGWLHTGDIAVRDEEGFYEIVDRLKELIKYKGYQVPPAELEALIVTHPDVADVAVVGVPDEEAGELPKAYVVPAGDLDPEALIAWVAERVSPQKQVRRVELVEEIPKSASGKILRRVLADRDRPAD